MRRAKTKKIKLNKKRLLVLMLCVLACIVLYLAIHQSQSKYVIEATQINTQQATSFYFESDVVDANTKTYTMNNWDGSNYDISFYVRNYTDNLQTSDEDIIYTIKTEVSTDSNTGSASASVVYTGGEGDLTSRSDPVTTTGDLTSLNLTGDGSTFSKNNYKLTVSQSNLEEGDTVTVILTVASSSTYEKEMKAVLKLTVKTIDSYESNLTDNGDYVTLTLKINDTDSDISVKYDTSMLVLDTSSKFLSSTNVTAGNIIIPASVLETGQVIEIYFAKIVESNTIDITVS